jgi:hypothetical protein
VNAMPNGASRTDGDERLEWNRARAWGKWRYIMHRGLVRQALPLLIGFALWETFLLRRTSVFTWPGVLSNMYVALVMFPVFGCVRAWRFWRENEKRLL